MSVTSNVVNDLPGPAQEPVKLGKFSARITARFGSIPASPVAFGWDFRDQYAREEAHRLCLSNEAPYWQTDCYKASLNSLVLATALNKPKTLNMPIHARADHRAPRRHEGLR